MMIESLVLITAGFVCVIVNRFVRIYFKVRARKHPGADWRDMSRRVTLPLSVLGMTLSVVGVNVLLLT